MKLIYTNTLNTSAHIRYCNTKIPQIVKYEYFMKHMVREVEGQGRKKDERERRELSDIYYILEANTLYL